MRDPLFWVPVKYKLPLTFVSICLVAFGVGGFIVTSTAKEALADQIRAHLDTRAAATRMVVRHHLDLIARRAEDFASDGFIRTNLAALVAGDAAAGDRLRRHLIANKLSLVASFADAALLDADGREVLNVHGGAAAAAPPVTAFTSLFPAGGARAYPSFAVATPLQHIDQDRRIGTLVLQVRADTWIDGMDELRALPRVAAHAVTVIDSGGARLGLAGAEEPRDAFTYEATIPETDWRLHLAVDRGAVMEPITGLRDRFMTIGAILLALTAGMLFFPVRFLLAPLGRIREAARRIAGGDFSTRVGYESKDEIGDLSRAFDIMAGAVEERTGKLKIQRDRLDAVIHSMRDGLFALDGAGQVTLANEAAQPLVKALTARHAVPRGEWEDCRGVACLQCLRESAGTRRACMIDVDDRVYEVHVTPLPGSDGKLCVSRDVTERIAQTQVQAHQERMAVLGNISAVMAHELNNPLAAIAMFSQMLETQLEAGTSAQESAEVIRRNAETCRQTIRGLLDTANQSPPQTAAFDLGDLVEDVRRFLQPIYERANVRFAADANGLVMGDELQLRQVLINLVMNAVQAMDGGGSVTVATSRSGSDTTIEVRDTGPGISEKQRARIFEPFFTTKPPGVGTGLGLSTSQRIVAAHGGSLELASTGSGGTTFRIVLPDSAVPAEVSHD